MMSAYRNLPALLLAALLILLVAAPTAWGQGATTGSLSGVVTDQDGTTALPGAVIEAVHQPTGTRYTTVTRNDGRFAILNTRVGGPYTVTATMAGFQPQEVNNIFVKLGDDVFLTFRLSLEAVEETLVVTATNPIINPSRTGATSSVPQEAVENLPTINRSIVDLARTNPFISATQSNANPSSLTVAGRNNRYNNIQIDGAVNNDLFGLAASGTPGGQSSTEPISLDAVEELQLLVSPYDVRQGGFSGGGVNLITKSGTNRFKGTGYYFDRDDGLIGDRDDNNGDDIPFGDFTDTQYGVSLGGAIVKDKVFFFVNGEVGEREQPTGFSLDGGSGEMVNALADAQTIRQILIDRYGFDPGGVGEFTRGTNSDKIFARLDFNLGDSNQLTFRHNYVDADNDIINPNAFTWEFSSHNYDFFDETNSTVLQLNSVFGSSMFNEFRVSYQTIDDNRSGAQRFPYIRIDDVGPNNNVDIEAGTERFSTANSLDQTVLEINNDFTKVFGNHTVTIGTHNEFFEFDNLFIRENFGSYRFRGGLEQFETGIADEFNYSFSSDPNDPLRSAQFEVQQLGLYAGDQWTVSPTFSVSYGLRVDVPFFPDDPTFNPQSLEFGFRTDEMPDGNEIWSPRAGFNWDISGDGKQQLRGGIGLFSGRTPYVWLSNQYSNTGIEFTRISARGDIPFNPDPDNQPTTVPGASTSTNEIDLVDPDFEFPQVFRASLGYDRDLGFLGLIGSVEVIWGQTEEDIAYQNLNITRTGERMNGLGNRPLFGRNNPNFRDVILLTNTSEGEQLNASLKIERPFRDGWFGSVSYVYGESESVNDGNSSQARSNWRFVPTTGDPNDVPVADSNFLVEHRFNGIVSYAHDWGGSGWNSTFSLFYNHQSGRPYSTTYSRDVNGDFETNDLIYVNRPGEIAFEDPADEARWEAYISADAGLSSARGSIVERNASLAPWTHTLDFRFAQDIPIWKIGAQISFEIENLGNLFDSDSGHVLYVNNAETSPLQIVTSGGQPVLADDGRPLHRLNFSDPDARFTTDNIRSRWRAKIGLRLSF